MLVNTENCPAVLNTSPPACKISFKSGGRKIKANDLISIKNKCQQIKNIYLECSKCSNQNSFEKTLFIFIKQG